MDVAICTRFAVIQWSKNNYMAIRTSNESTPTLLKVAFFHQQVAKRRAKAGAMQYIFDLIPEHVSNEPRKARRQFKKKRL